MSDLFGMPDPGPLPKNGRFPLSPKQRAVIEHLRKAGQITLTEAVCLIGRDIYANQKFHVGNVLSNMVKRGLLMRVKPGVFKLP